MTSSITNRKCLSISIIDSLQDCRLKGKLYKWSLSSRFIIFQNWKFRYFKLYQSDEYALYDAACTDLRFKILIYYKDECEFDKKGIVIIFDEDANAIPVKRYGIPGYKCFFNSYKLQQDGQIPSTSTKLYLYSNSLDELAEWIKQISSNS